VTNPDWADYLQAAVREHERVRPRDPRLFPHYSEAGTWRLLDVDARSSWQGETYEHGNWTAGFWFGTMWLAALGRDHDPDITEVAQERLPLLAPRAYDHTTHDLGFLFYPSYVLGHLCGYVDDTQLGPAVEAARMTARRFNDQGRYLQAFGPVGEARSARTSTIDTMMNLPLLWWAHRRTGDTRLFEVARHHARTTARVFIRPDGSTAHLMHFDPVSGAVDAESTLQGASARSAWSRGSGWAVGGLAWAYAATGETELLTGAERASTYYEAAGKPDELPPWDFTEAAADAPRDASAAAAVALGRLILGQVHPDGTSRERYEQSAARLLTTLSRQALNRDPSVDGILLHSCYSVPQGVGVDGATGWGDFFYGLAMAVKHGVIPVPRLLG
jgi:unsaturated chondroitin disaccharide hydrolase